MASGFCGFLIATTYLIQMVLLAKEKIYYMDFEHVNVTYINTKYLRNCNVSAQRIGRRDPVHYVHLHGESLVPAGNNVSLDIYVYEFLSNEYRRSFVEMHFKWCDLLFGDPIFGPIVNKYLPNTCPTPMGEYHLSNLSLIDVPFLRTFPFQKGRVFVNTTVNVKGGVRERVTEGYVDVVIKQKWR